jgi:hypothetical protein
MLQNLAKFSKKILLQPPQLVAEVLVDVTYNLKKWVGGGCRRGFFLCCSCQNAPMCYRKICTDALL